MTSLVVQCFLGVCLIINGMDVYDLTRQGRKLPASDVTKLESKLKEDPKDIDTRTILLGYYFGSRSSSDRAQEKFQKHVLWLTENSPEAKVLGIPDGGLIPYRSSDAFEKAKVLWLKHLEDQPKNLAILGNASQFFMHGDHGMARKILERAKEIAPKDPAWPEKLGNHFSRRTIGLKRQESIEAIAAKALKQYELAYELSSENGRDSLLGKMGKVAFMAGELEKAKTYAALMIEPPEDRANSWNYGNKVHHGNNLLGQIALAAGDLEEAKKRLLEAGQTPGSPQLNSFGPSMQLAKELLEAGETKTVIEYFAHCENFWQRGNSKLGAWRKSVKAGVTPDFGSNLRR